MANRLTLKFTAGLVNRPLSRASYSFSSSIHPRTRNLGRFLVSKECFYCRRHHHHHYQAEEAAATAYIISIPFGEAHYQSIIAKERQGEDRNKTGAFRLPSWSAL